MNIQTVRDNLRNTIAGKEQLLEEYQAILTETCHGPVTRAGYAGGVQMLEINIGELKRILQDVEQLVPYREADAGAYGPEYQGQ